mmetsp:Transcript_19189/g.54198  ORF Transcript_19189/g.54198 Transcript_19189/m.54198 type:complete len:301 (+) Transcript_19189:2415-3317(+)
MWAQLLGACRAPCTGEGVLGQFDNLLVEEHLPHSALVVAYQPQLDRGAEGRQELRELALGQGLVVHPEPRQQVSRKLPLGRLNLGPVVGRRGTGDRGGAFHGGGGGGLPLAGTQILLLLPQPPPVANTLVRVEVDPGIRERLEEVHCEAHFPAHLRVGREELAAPRIAERVPEDVRRGGLEKLAKKAQPRAEVKEPQLEVRVVGQPDGIAAAVVEVPPPCPRGLPLAREDGPAPREVVVDRPLRGRQLLVLDLRRQASGPGHGGNCCDPLHHRVGTDGAAVFPDAAVVPQVTVVSEQDPG